MSESIKFCTLGRRESDFQGAGMEETFCAFVRQENEVEVTGIINEFMEITNCTLICRESDYQGTGKIDEFKKTDVYAPTCYESNIVGASTTKMMKPSESIIEILETVMYSLKIRIHIFNNNIYNTRTLVENSADFKLKISLYLHNKFM